MVDLSKVKVGDTVKRRDGEVESIKVIEIDLTDNTPYRFNNLYSHTKNGHWFPNEKESTKDIVEHIPQVQVIENIDVTKIQVGDYIVFRDTPDTCGSRVNYIKEPAKGSPYVVTFSLGLGFNSYTRVGNFYVDGESRYDIMRVDREGKTIMEREEPTVVNSDDSIKRVYLINGKLFSTETLSTLNNLELLKEIGVQVEVKDVL